MAKTTKDADKAMLSNLLQTTLPNATKIEAPVQMVVPVKEQPPAEKLEQVIVRIPAAKKKDWKQFCLDKDLFLQDLIIEAVDEKIAKMK